MRVFVISRMVLCEIVYVILVNGQHITGATTISRSDSIYLVTPPAEYKFSITRNNYLHIYTYTDVCKQ